MRHDHNAFAPQRISSDKPRSEICRAQWHICGESMMAAVHKAILSATRQILIQGW